MPGGSRVWKRQGRRGDTVLWQLYMQTAVKSTALNDYMMTYENYYGITKQDNPEKYDAVVSVYFDAFAAFLHRHGVCGTLKHFAANNQEHERHMVNGVISQRAQREIYLKGFEIAYRESSARCIMSSYGPVNGLWTASSYDLLTTILRKEWGFRGLVMSDWWAHGNEEGEAPSRQEVAAMVRSQNDLYMVNLNAEGNSNHDNLMTSLGTEKLTRRQFASLQRMI